MRRMYTEKQIKEFAKGVQKRLYYHYIPLQPKVGEDLGVFAMPLHLVTTFKEPITLGALKDGLNLFSGLLVGQDDNGTPITWLDYNKIDEVDKLVINRGIGLEDLRASFEIDEESFVDEVSIYF